jgi:crotonobetainyl-CoA:carnitine CoA-transferase CaiB-like acyl-CoA transferase
VTVQHLNRGKQSVALDLKQEAGQDIAQRLPREAMSWSRASGRV